MKAFFRDKKRSAGYARDRMKLLLKSDLIHTVKKYLTIEEEQVKLKITQEPAVLYVYVPVLDKKDR